MSDKSDKTEKATPKKLKDARRKGQVVQTPELAAWLGILAVALLLEHTASSVVGSFRQTVRGVADLVSAPDVDLALGLFGTAMRDGLLAIALLVGVLAVIGTVASLAQVGVAFTPAALKPQKSRVSPVQGIKRLFGAKGLWEAGKSVLKLAVLAAVGYQTLASVLPRLVDIDGLSIQGGVALAADATVTLMRNTAIAGLLLAAVDYAVQKRNFAKDMRMSMRDVKQEMKQSEGDPHVRGAIRQRQMQMSRNRMMADVAGADVVVVNPTHVAVALKYHPERGAPRVVAKGSGEIAAAIRRRAQEHRVPIVRDVPLARSLAAGCEVGDEVPPQLYTAVARVLAFIYSLRRRGASPVGTHELTAYGAGAR